MSSQSLRIVAEWWCGSLYSAEFRYMLPQLPILESTRLYAYFSIFYQTSGRSGGEDRSVTRMTEIGRLTKIEAARVAVEMMVTG